MALLGQWLAAPATRYVWHPRQRCIAVYHPPLPLQCAEGMSRAISLSLCLCSQCLSSFRASSLCKSLDFVRVVVPQAPAVFGEMIARWEEEGSGGSMESILQLMSCRAIAVVSLNIPCSRSETIVMLK
jgi:hypothetical protein